MIEKLKALVGMSKDVLLYILAPLSVVLIYILHLRNKVSDLEVFSRSTKAEKDLIKSVSKLELLKKEAQDAEDAYKASRNKPTS